MSKKIMKKKCEGKCPKCKSKNIDWYDSDLQGNYMIYNAQCDNCDTEFIESYKLVYEITQYFKRR